MRKFPYIKSSKSYLFPTPRHFFFLFIRFNLLTMSLLRFPNELLYQIVADIATLAWVTSTMISIGSDTALFEACVGL